AVVVSTLCVSGLIEGPSQCVEYARSSDVVVYGAESLDHLPTQNFEHRIFVARGDHRIELDTLDLYLGEPRILGDVVARVNEFEVQGRRYADVVIEGHSSGGGEISETVDYIFALGGDGLRLIGKIETGG